MSSSLKRFSALTLCFFALYALTAQRGLGWGDSGEFQYRVLRLGDGLLQGCDSFATAHPLYVAFAKAFCSTPFQVTLVSALFGALAVGGFYLCTGSAAFATVFGLSHAVWWLSCVAEVYTMSLAFLVLEVFLLRKTLEKGWRWAIALFFANALHLEVHNVALLSLPVYLAALVPALRPLPAAKRIYGLLAVSLSWAAGASFWLWALLDRGAADVLFGGYGAQTFGMLPERWSVAAFNLVLSAVSFFVPVLLWVLSLRRPSGSGAQKPSAQRWIFAALFAVHFAFWVRYFIISQFTFVLPPLFLFCMFASTWDIRIGRPAAWVAVQLLLPVAVYSVLSLIPVPQWRKDLHPYRDEAAYFALPWKFNDRSADRLAEELGGEWNGYPYTGKGAGK